MMFSGMSKLAVALHACLVFNEHTCDDASLQDTVPVYVQC